MSDMSATLSFSVNTVPRGVMQVWEQRAFMTTLCPWGSAASSSSDRSVSISMEAVRGLVADMPSYVHATNEYKSLLERRGQRELRSRFSSNIRRFQEGKPQKRPSRCYSGSSPFSGWLEAKVRIALLPLVFAMRQNADLAMKKSISSILSKDTPKWTSNFLPRAFPSSKPISPRLQTAAKPRIPAAADCKA